MRSFRKRPRPPLNEMDSDRLSKAIVALANLVARLRGPGGCPWDAKQTDSSIGIYLLEEAYEVLDAIEISSPGDVCQELGDLLFQILFMAKLAEERKEFDFIEVIERITEKMIRRHPHVFGKTMVDNAEDVALNWAKIKKREKGASHETSSLLESVPMNLPALLRAHRLSERAAKEGFQRANSNETWVWAQKRFEKLRSAIKKEDRVQVADDMGELLFSLVNLAREHGLNAEHTLRISNRRFLDRFERMERELKASGIEPEEATPEQMEHAWKRVKSRSG